MSSTLPLPAQRGLALVVAFVLALAALMPLAAPPAVRAVSETVVISQVYGGGGNSGATYTHDFIELYNVSDEPINLAGMSLQYASATGTGNFGSSTTMLTELSGTIQPGGYFLVQEAPGAGGTEPLPSPDLVDPSPIAMGASGGKVVLATGTDSLGCNGGSTPCTDAQEARIVDLVGFGSANYYEGSGPAPAPSNTTSVTRTNAPLDTDDNAADFTTGAPNPRNSGTNSGPGTALSATGSASPSTVEPGGTTTLSVTVTPGTEPDSTDIVVTGDLRAIGGSETQPFSDADGDLTYVYEATLGGTIEDGPKSLPISVEDGQGREAPISISLTVESPLQLTPIGEIQGSVDDDDDGTAHRSPFAPPSGNSNGQEVLTSGVITQKFLQRTSSGGTNNGFFLQSTVESADGDPDSSDGIFVFHSRFRDLRIDGGGFYVPQVGDEVVLRGPVSEFFNVTQLGSPFLVEVLRSGVPLTGEDAEIEWTVADPDDGLAEANRFWERHEGMQMVVEAGAVVTAGRSVFASTADGEVWVINGDHAVAQRTEPYANRVFRDPHRLDDTGPVGSFDNGNGYRIMLASHGLKAAAGDTGVLIDPARTFDTVTNTLTGALYYTFGKYAIEVMQQPELEHGLDPSGNAPPVEPDREVEYSTAIYNVENLYDFRDDPFDGCDFAGNGGCPGVRPPFDYVPASDAAYQQQLTHLADQIATDLHAPDILLIQEAEDQDICTVDGGSLECGDVDDADGKPDTLQELALVIEAAYGVAYDAAYDRDGADDRGIVNGFLYRTDRVELLDADATHPVLGNDPQIDYAGAGLDYNADVQNPKAINAELPAGTPGPIDGCDVEGVDCVFTRDAQVGYFRVWRDGIGTSVFTDLYAITNHFSSGPDNRVGQRTQQAALNAAIVEALGLAEDGERVVTGGDFNVFPRPDDPFAPGHPLFPSDQLAALYEIGLNDLWAVVAAEAPANAYSYAFEGQAQTLDNQFTTDALFDELNGVRFAHINADFPAEYDGDGSRGASDHDPQAARFSGATPDALVNLVEYLLDAGAIDESKAEQLLSRLEVIGDLVDDGNTPAALAQLEAFGNQVDGLSPRWIEPDAAEILQIEAEVLASTL